MHGNQIFIISLVASAAAIITAIISLVTARKVRQWRDYFQDDKQPENLEEIIASIATKIKNLEIRNTAQQAELGEITEKLSFAIQYTALVRFNALADEGGNLSFALALLDARKSGTIITSLHGRQGNRLYTKRIIAGVGETALSDEEQDALFQALGSRS